MGRRGLRLDLSMDRRERAERMQPAQERALGADKNEGWGDVKWCMHRAEEALCGDKS